MPDRLAVLRERIAELGLDAIVITHPSNRYYLTGYTGDDIPPNESGGHVIVTADRAVLVTSTVNSEQARQQASGFEVFDRVYGLTEADATLLTEMGVRRVGFEDKAILYQDHRTLTERLGDGVELVPVGTLVDDMRVIKTSDEITKIARAIEVTDRAFEQVAATIQAGDRERDIAWRLESAMRELGASGPSFPTIVASGPNAALPHHEPGDRQIQPGEPIVIDMGARVDGYCADLTRTVWVGEPDSRLREIYPIVLRALEAAEAGLRAGITGREGDALARDVIEQAGYGEAFGHSLGHGVGVRVHEGPALSKRNEEPLPAGSVVTIEPGIYIPGWGGVRIEDVGVLEDKGIRILTRAAKRSID
ncbi:aminopeptidase P family protein [Sphaerobacter sp.]|uniref:M24 family metallopeptidase n=1 Tax=Sphaerobacter sp. TaxID=2099654 RepID=UPI001DB31AFC|nr:aminopeptidase P family protein [Sphaerobacter sp.]MBX5446128.1 aminopeptidase P family protein [Sphaerobacter sp.]